MGVGELQSKGARVRVGMWGHDTWRVRVHTRLHRAQSVCDECDSNFDVWRAGRTVARGSVGVAGFLACVKTTRGEERRSKKRPYF